MGIKEYVSKKKEQFAKYKQEQAAKAEKAAGDRRVKEAAEIRRLREQRLKEEMDANLRLAKQKEQARIEKARSVGRPKPQQSSGSGNMFDLGGFAGSGSSDLGMGSMFGQPSKKAPDPFDLGMGGVFGSPAPKPKARKHSKKRKR